MSVAEPILDYVESIRTEASISRSTNMFKNLLRYHKPFIPIVIVILVLAAVRSYAFILEPLYTAEIIDEVIIQGKNDLLLGLVLKIVAATGAYAALNFAITYIQGYVAQLILRNVRSDYYASLQSKSFKFYDSTAVGDLVSRATMDLQGVEDFLKTWMGVSAHAIFTGILMFMVMYSINPIMALIAALPLVLIFYFLARLQIKTMPLFRKMNLILGRLGAYVQQNILGMKVVRIFEREAEMEKGFRQVEDRFVDIAITAGKLQSKYMPSSPAILTLGIALVYLYGGNLIASPSSILTIGELTLFARYMTRLTIPLRDLSVLVGVWVNASAGLERIFEIMKRQIEVEDNPNAKNLVITIGKVEFRDVTFGYAKDKPVLRNVSFTISPGERIAILGSTGSGKTSLIYLIPRFYDVDSGKILIDDVDVRSFRLSSLRKQIGLVMQNVFIFTGTIRNNIAFGKPNASLDEVISAAKLAKMHDFIEALPEGYNTIVGERGITLSGGQRQRMTIARTLLTNPRILILDDSLSFVDARTEKDIQEAIEKAMEGRTCFMIAQRLSTIKNADRIMLLDEGEIVEFGTHRELLAKGGIYKRIYETQFLEKDPELTLQTEEK